MAELNPPPKRCAKCGADNLPFAAQCASCSHDFEAPLRLRRRCHANRQLACGYCATCGAGSAGAVLLCLWYGCGRNHSSGGDGRSQPWRVGHVANDSRGRRHRGLARRGGGLGDCEPDRGHQAAVANVTPSPSLSATFTPTLTPTGTPGTEFAGTACRLVSDLTAAHNDDVVPIVQLITGWTTSPSIPVGPEPRGRAAAWDAAAAQVVSRNGAVAGSLRSADHPQLVADIARAYSSYGSASRRSRQHSTTRTLTSLSAFQTGMQQLADGKAALDDAQSQLELLTAAGSANCP